MRKKRKGDDAYRKWRLESDERVRRLRERLTRELAELETRKAADRGRG